VKKFGPAVAGIVLLASYFTSIFDVVAQDLPDRPAKVAKPVSVLLPGAVTGIETYGPFGRWRLCNSRSVALNELQVRFVEQLIRPNETQKQRLDELASASARAKAALTSSCPREALNTSNAVLRAMEKRVTGLLEVLKIIRPAYEHFYASLDGRQKARIEALGPTRRGWRW